MFNLKFEFFYELSSNFNVSIKTLQALCSIFLIIYVTAVSYMIIKIRMIYLVMIILIVIVIILIITINLHYHDNSMLGMKILHSK